MFENIIHDQISIFFLDILSKYQCGFRKSFSAQHDLIAIIEKWKESVYNRGTCGALLTGPSKAFDFISHELLIAKLSAYRPMDLISKL